MFNKKSTQNQPFRSIVYLCSDALVLKFRFLVTILFTVQLWMSHTKHKRIVHCKEKLRQKNLWETRWKEINFFKKDLKNFICSSSSSWNILLLQHPFIVITKPTRWLNYLIDFSDWCCQSFGERFSSFHGTPLCVLCVWLWNEIFSVSVRVLWLLLPHFMV